MNNLIDIYQHSQRSLFDAGIGVAQFVGPELFQEVAAALIVFTVGWFAAKGKSKRHHKERMVDELIIAQRELMERAYPEHWSSKGRRDIWMLNPYLERLKFVFVNIKDENALTKKQQMFIEEYFFSVEKFLIQWSQTRSRGPSYNSRFQDTFVKLHDVVLHVSKSDLDRLARLGESLGSRTAQFETMPDQFKAEDERIVAAE